MTSAVDALHDLGLTEYEAKVYVALVKIGTGTASDIHMISGVPRSAVYGALDRLNLRGAIDIQSSKPMICRAVPPEAALEKFKARFVVKSRDALSVLEEIYGTEALETRKEAIWTINGVKNVSEKIIEMIRGSKADIIFAASYPSFHEIAKRYLVFNNIKDTIRDKIGEGITVRITGSCNRKLEKIAKEFSGADIRVFSDDKATASGGILIVDGREVLIAIVCEGVGSGIEDMTAIWTDGEGAVSVFKHFVETEWNASAAI